MPDQSKVKQIRTLRNTNNILYRSSIAKNSNYRIALQLYYISKAGGKREARLPKNDFRRAAVKPQREVSTIRRFINQVNFDFANAFAHKVITRKFFST